MSNFVVKRCDNRRGYRENKIMEQCIVHEEVAKRIPNVRFIALQKLK